jgi:uncharacterized membrane protein YdjX (TVP38/TMEM64 family)
MNEPAQPKRSRRVFILVGLFIAIGIAFLFLPVSHYVQQLRGYFAEAGWWGRFLYVVVYILATILLIPASALTLLAGGLYGFTTAFLLTVLASNLGANCAFLLGRGALRKRVEDWAREAPRFAALREAAGRNGFKIVALTRLSPVFPFTLLNYVLGLAPITYPQYALATFLGMLPGTALFVYIGALSGELASGERPQTLKLVSQGAGLVATIVATFYIARMAKRALNESNVAHGEH